MILRSGRLSVAYSTNGYYDSIVFVKNQVTLCDGHWHSVTFSKAGYQLNIMIDFVTDSNNAIPDNQLQNLVISSQLYIGGVPPGSDGEQFAINTGIQHILGQGGDFVVCLLKFHFSCNNRNRTNLCSLIQICNSSLIMNLN